MPEFLENNYTIEDSFLKSLRSKQRNLNYCDVFSQSVRGLSVKEFPKQIQEFIECSIQLCEPKDVHFVDGSESENKMLVEKMVCEGVLIPLPKYKNCWLCRTDPRDVARVEGKTFITTDEKRDTIPEPKSGVKGALGNWLAPADMDKAISERFPGCMKDRVMYVIPFSMGPIGSPLSKLGVQITDSAYVVTSMRVMTRMGEEAVAAMKEGVTVVRALHSVGTPKDGKFVVPTWPCDPERTIIMHRPPTNEIVSYGSGYGGNSLLGKKCFALRIGSTIAKAEGWLAEHMLILGITPPSGKKKYLAAAFPSACGKTNLAMLEPSIPGFKVECVGDDIAWIKFNEKTKMFHAINPENGFFGVAPGTSWKTNPNAMASMQCNAFFTNVAYTCDGGVWWEGMDPLDKDMEVTDWLGKSWDRKKPAAHANSRFTAPASQCPIIDPLWEAHEGVPLSAILFGGRRPEGVPLIYETFSWEHGVLVGAGMRSEATAAAEFKGKAIMHDPFAMRPFFGYNFGHYLDHWLCVGQTKDAILPKIFHVNWFRKSKEGKFLWPGFGDNIRVLDWVLKRVDCEDGIAEKTPIGWVPKENSINIEGFKEKPDMKELLSVPKDFWIKETEALEKYFDEQLPKDLPEKVRHELKELRDRLKKS